MHTFRLSRPLCIYGWTLQKSTTRNLKTFPLGFLRLVSVWFFCPFRISPFDIFAFSSFLIWGLVALPRKYWWNWKSNEWAYQSRHCWWRIQCHGDAPVKTCAFSRSICFLPIVLECDSLAVKTHKLSFSLDRRLPVPFNIWYVFVCVNVSVSSAPLRIKPNVRHNGSISIPLHLFDDCVQKVSFPFSGFPPHTPPQQRQQRQPESLIRCVIVSHFLQWLPFLHHSG